MSSKRDDEELERLLDAAELPERGADPLAALLRAAAAPKDGAETDRALNAEEAAVAAFRAAFASRPEQTTAPRPRPIRRTRTLTGATAVLGAALLITLAAVALPRLVTRNPQHNTSPAFPTAQLTPRAPSPAASDTGALPLDNNATLTSAAQQSPTSSARSSATPVTVGRAQATKKPHGQGTYEHTTKTGRK